MSTDSIVHVRSVHSPRMYIQLQMSPKYMYPPVRRNSKIKSRNDTPNRHPTDLRTGRRTEEPEVTTKKSVGANLLFAVVFDQMPLLEIAYLLLTGTLHWLPRTSQADDDDDPDEDHTRNHRT